MVLVHADVQSLETHHISVLDHMPIGRGKRGEISDLLREADQLGEATH
jgi:hypothetical protein